MLKIWCPDRLRSWPALDGKGCHAVYTIPLKDVQGVLMGENSVLPTQTWTFEPHCIISVLTVGKALALRQKSPHFPWKPFNIVEFNTARAFGHPAELCWMVLNEIWLPSDFWSNVIQYFFCSQMRSTMLNLWCWHVQLCWKHTGNVN